MRLGPVLPARFGTLFSSTASLESFMRKHEAAIARFLERVGGQEEWAVKGFLDQARAEAEWMARRRSEEPCPSGSSPGVTYLQEQSLRIQARQALDVRLTEACDDLLHQLNSLASEIVPRAVLARETPEAARELVLNWALLLPAAAVADFRGRIERANAEQNPGGLAFEVSGPWPPYSFCPVLEAEAVSGRGDRGRGRTMSGDHADAKRDDSLYEMLLNAIPSSVLAGRTGFADHAGEPQFPGKEPAHEGRDAGSAIAGSLSARDFGSHGDCSAHSKRF